MTNSNQKPQGDLRTKVLWTTKICLIFLSAFVAMSLFEFRNFQRTSSRVADHFTKISNVNTHISTDNLDRYEGRTVVLYNSKCKPCQNIIPKYYAINKLVNGMTFHKAPIYLDIKQYNNAETFAQLAVPSTPKQTKIISASYNDARRLTDIKQDQSDVNISRMAGMLVFVNVFWSALLALLYVILPEGAHYFFKKSPNSKSPHKL